MGSFGKANQHLNKKPKVCVQKCVCEAVGNMIRLNGQNHLTSLNNKVNNVPNRKSRRYISGFSYAI